MVFHDWKEFDIEYCNKNKRKANKRLIMKITNVKIQTTFFNYIIIWAIWGDNVSKIVYHIRTDSLLSVLNWRGSLSFKERPCTYVQSDCGHNAVSVKKNLFF